MPSPIHLTIIGLIKSRHQCSLSTFLSPLISNRSCMYTCHRRWRNFQSALTKSKGNRLWSKLILFFISYISQRQSLSIFFFPTLFNISLVYERHDTRKNKKPNLIILILLFFCFFKKIHIYQWITLPGFVSNI